MKSITKVSVLEERVNNLIDKVDKIDGKLDSIETSMKTWMENADKRYASKFFEKVMWGGAGALALWFLNQIFHLVEIH